VRGAQALLLLALVAVVVLLRPPRAGAEGRAGEMARKPDPGCISCHEGIEEMHPWEPLTCVECHGGDGQSRDKARAHVPGTRPAPNDERTLPLKYDLAYRRFLNPTDLRVVGETCARCHAAECVNLEKSLHGTTAGHLSDGLYENGVVRDRKQRFSIFPVRDDDGTVPANAYKSMPAIPPASIANPSLIGQHFSDLPRKSCMQCHLYSRGVGLRGRLGQDGWYRGEGCGTCHILYAHDGLSQGGDPNIDRLEPGHPIKHQMTSKIPTATCTTCHALDANIGMSFTGVAQLPPGVPGGPDVPGTTDRLSKGRFFLNDPAICPPDVHYQRGMHCIDCHDSADTMGDGNLYGEMEYAVGVSCSTCHGTFTSKATFETTRGGKLKHLRWEGDEAILTGRVTGKEHRVKQVVDVLDRRHPDFNASAAKSMDPITHGRMECYSCHSAWSVNFFGFHFDRNEQFTQLDILGGQRTPGQVSSQEKIFATFRHYYLGVNSEGRIAPYMVGFSTAGTFRDKSGKTILRQELPVTAAGLSGMTLIHHQLHTVQPAARHCAECHGAPSVLGAGSENFHLFRDLFVVVGDAGLTVAGFDVKSPDKSVAIANTPLPSHPRHVAVANDPLSGRMKTAYVACRDGSVQIVDLAEPVSPKRVGAFDAKDARQVHVREGMLFVAAGKEGLLLASLENPQRPRPVAQVRTTEARGVFVDGVHAYVADGPGGLRVVDVSVPRKPALVATLDCNGEETVAQDANDVLVHFLAARPDVAARRRTQARNVAFIADGESGLYLVDITRPREPKTIPVGGRRGFPGLFRGAALAFSSSYDIGSTGGDIPSREREYLYIVGTEGSSSNGTLVKMEVGEPESSYVVATRRTVNDPRAVRIARVYQAPFLKQFALVAGRGNGDLEIADVTGRTNPIPQAGAIDGVGPAVGVDLEYLPLDRLVGFDGLPLKDVSHEGARLFTSKEIARILFAEVK